QGVGLLQSMEEKIVYLEGSNQEFLLRNLEKQHTRLEALFNKFVDEQVRAIEDTKVKLKKRKGVIAFIKTFPVSSSSTQEMCIILTVSSTLLSASKSSSMVPPSPSDAWSTRLTSASQPPSLTPSMPSPKSSPR